MHRTLKGIITLATFAAAAACSDVGTPTEASFVTPPEQPVMGHHNSSQLSFSYTQSQSSQTAQSSLGGIGKIDFTGSLTTGNPCVELTASHTARSSDVTVTVSASSTGGACIQVITYNNYEGSVSGLAPGTYNFTVIHNLGGSRTTAHTSTVTVL